MANEKFLPLQKKELPYKTSKTHRSVLLNPFKGTRHISGRVQLLVVNLARPVVTCNFQIGLVQEFFTVYVASFNI
jgi:hypothetical protein